MSSNSSKDTGLPSQAAAQATSAQGALYEIIGNVTGATSWTEDGEAKQAQAQADLERIKGAAAVDKVAGKVQSAFGMVTGQQETQNEGNIKTEKANLTKAAADQTLPQLTSEMVKGKVQSAVGMATGDTAKQNEGNVRTEKAEWTGK